jgi:hypothetical protein
MQAKGFAPTVIDKSLCSAPLSCNAGVIQDFEVNQQFMHKETRRVSDSMKLMLSLTRCCVP